LIVAPHGDTGDVAKTPEVRVRLNEIVAVNDGAYLDEDGNPSDWIELFHAGEQSISLVGWSLTDKEDEPQKWVFPDVEMEPGEYRVVFASGKDRKETSLHTNFKLSSGGEFLGLFDADGQEIDAIKPVFPKQVSGFSYGVSDEGQWHYLVPATPGEANGNTDVIEQLPGLNFSHPGGTFIEPFSLTLEGLPPENIRYTTDGEIPDQASTAYTGPILIEKSTQVRVWTLEDGKEDISSRVYVALDEELASFSSNLPLVFVDSEERPMEEGEMAPISAVFLEPDQSGRTQSVMSTSLAGRAGMRIRGNSSKGYEKKQYAFEWWDNADEDKNRAVLGMPEDSDWVIQGPYSDKTLMRNHLMYTWSNRAGRYAPRTRFVEVFLNDNDSKVHADDYLGVYVVMEKIKRGKDRVDIDKLGENDNDTPHVTGGYLLKKDWWDEGFDTAVYEDYLIYVYPDSEKITSAQEEWVQSHFNAFEQALAGPSFADPVAGYRPFIDVDSFVDHHLFVEMARNVDGYVLSTFLHKDREGLINMGPIWDYNGALGGADYFCTYQVAGWHFQFDESQCGGGGETFPADNPNAYHWYARLFEDPAFVERYGERWGELRQSALSTEKLLEDIDAVAKLLSEAQERNFERWEILGEYIWPNAPGFDERNTFNKEVDYLKEWLLGRLAWMDEQLL